MQCPVRLSLEMVQLFLKTNTHTTARWAGLKWAGLIAVTVHVAFVSQCRLTGTYLKGHNLSSEFRAFYFTITSCIL